MRGAEDMPGWSVPLHRSLTEPILMGGIPRGIAIALGTLAAAIGLGLQLWLAGIAVYVLGHGVALFLTRQDPQFLAVFLGICAPPGTTWTSEGRRPCSISGNTAAGAASWRTICPGRGWSAPGVVLNKDGSLQRTARFRGPDLDASTPAELVAVSARVNNALKRLGEGWALFVEAARRAAPGYPESRFPDPASWLIDEERRAAFEQEGAQFESDQFLTFCFLAPPEDEPPGRAGFSTSAARALGRRAVSRQCRRPPANALARGAGGVPRRDGPGAGSAGSPHAGMRLARRWRDPRLSAWRRLDPWAPSGRGARSAVLSRRPAARLRSDAGHRPHARALPSAHADPARLAGSDLAGAARRAQPAALEYRWVARWLPLEKAEAQKELGRKRRHWWSKRKGIAALLREVIWQQETRLIDSDAENQSLDADVALQELGSDAVSFGFFTATITVWDEDEAAVAEKVKLIGRVVRSQGFVAVEETLNAVEAWLSSLPGQCYANVRQPPVSSLNLVHMLPLSAVWAGPAGNRHLDGPPLLVARTSGATPFRLVLHQGDVGHTLILGPTGAGKSVLLALIALQFRRYPRSRVMLFDKGRSSKAAVLAAGGTFHDLTLGGEAGAVAFQPLARIDEPEERAWAAEWISDTAPAGAGRDHPGGAGLSFGRPWVRWRRPRSASARSRALPPCCSPTGSPLRSSPIPSLVLTAACWTPSMKPSDDAEVVAFETEDLLGSKPAARAVLLYLFHRIERVLDGRPTLIGVDEAWFALDDPVFAPKLREWLKTLRRKNASVLFSTQSLADVMRSAMAPAVIESCLSRIFLPNASTVTFSTIWPCTPSFNCLSRSHNGSPSMRSMAGAPSLVASRLESLLNVPFARRPGRWGSRSWSNFATRCKSYVGLRCPRLTAPRNRFFKRRALQPAAECLGCRVRPSSKFKGLPVL